MSSPRVRTRRRRGALSVAAAALLLAGCGKSGAPLPPLPSGPLPPADVEPRQLGRRTFVAFRVSPARRAGTAAEPVETELVRVAYPPGPAPPADADAFRRRGVPVGRIVDDPLTIGATLLVEDRALDALDGGGTGWTLRYAVRVRDRRGRPSALVMANDLVPSESGRAPTELEAEPTVDGMRLRWTAPADGDAEGYNVYRTAAVDASARVPLYPLNPVPLDESGFLDSTVVTGERYRYTVRRALAAGRPLREGPPSAAAEVRAEDRFPPAPPTGLVAVQEGPSVRLFWDPGGEADLAGYHVERRDDGAGWRRLTDVAAREPRFLDRDVRAERRYAYRVTAVDRTTPPNESAASGVVEVEVLVDPQGVGP